MLWSSGSSLCGSDFNHDILTSDGEQGSASAEMLSHPPILGLHADTDAGISKLVETLLLF